MITRRNFLKLAGLSTLAVGSGYLTGKIAQTSKPVYYSVHGFIPEDEAVLRNILAVFKSKVKSCSEAFVLSDSKFGEVLTRLDKELNSSNYLDKGKITYKLKKLGNQINSDIIISDKDNSIYSIEDFNLTLFNIRNEIKGKKANYALSVEYNESDFFSSLFSNNKREVLIQNEKGVVEKISLEKNYRDVWVDGLQGKTGLEIFDGFVRVHTSSCRHEICKHSVAKNIGDVIACAPNKVLVKIV